jgi:hypothetical protein
MAGRTLTPAQQETADQARRETVEQLHQQLAEGIANLDNRDEWQRYLRFARGFHQYSFGNQILLLRARPDATAVCGYRGWQTKGYQVRRGEKAIRILGPVTRRVPLTDPAGQPLMDDQGRPRYGLEMTGVRPVSVWDISQTDGPPVPEAPKPVLLTGQAPPRLWDSLAEIVTEQGYRLERGDCGTANGLTSYAERFVRVRDDVDDASQVRTLAHEVGHVLLADPAQVAGIVDCRGLREVEAESIAFMVSEAHGLRSGQYTFNYVTGWASQASDTLTAEQVVRATGQRVIDTVDKILAHTKPTPTTGELLQASVETALDHDVAAAGRRWGPIAHEPNPGARAERAAGVGLSQPSRSLGVGR